jgi:hypothetical protein
VTAASQKNTSESPIDAVTSAVGDEAEPHDEGRHEKRPFHAPQGIRKEPRRSRAGQHAHGLAVAIGQRLVVDA